jgi:hypothetical protein
MAKWLDKYNTPEAQNGIEGTMAGLTDQGFNYNGAWGGTMAMGGSLPGSVGFTYARTQDPAPSKGKYAKKTMASAQDGKKISYNQWKKQNNLKETPDYNLKRAWELGYTPDKTGHLPTVDNQTGKFLKAKGHPTLNLELDWYNSPEGAEFKSKNTLDSTGKFFKYVPKLQNGQEMKFYQEGLDWKPKNISQNGTVVPNWATDINTRLLNAVSTFGGSAIGDAVKGVSPRAADWLNENSMGFIPYTTDEQLMATRAGNPDRGVNTAVQASDAVTNLLLNKMIGPLAGKANTAIKKETNKVVKGATNFAQDFSKGYKAVPTREDGGIIEDDRGQWEYPGEITKINSNKITMQGVDYPVLGISDTGDTQIMQPGQDYTYEGESVTEIPMMQDGGLMSYREPILNAKDRFVQKQMNKFGDAKFVNRALEIAEKQGYDYGADDGGPLDAVRHAAMSASVAKNLKVPKVIGKYAPALDDAIRMGAANLMGFGYELSNFNEGEGFLMDMKNNYIGSDIGVMKNLTDEERAKKIAGMLKYNKLSIDNTKKPKKENGGWLSKYN